jgi:uncharacterized protein (TIGR03083 family)
MAIGSPNVVPVFLECAEVSLSALADRSVAAAWDSPSVLEGWPVGDLARHLARGIWLVGEYLAAEPPSKAPSFASPADYFAVLAERATEADYRASHQREATLTPATHDELVTMLSERLKALPGQLASGPPDRLVAVFAGLVIRLDHYLATRIVEQVVHLDDLARSVGHKPWPTPSADRLVVVVGADVGLRRFGGTAMIRALYRDGFSEAAFPVL